MPQCPASVHGGEFVLPSDNRKPAAADAPLRAPVAEFLRRHAPFDRMTPAELDFLAARLSLAFYPQNSVIADPQQGEARTFYIIKQGRVRGETADDDGAWELVAGECFPVGALLARRPVHTVHRAVEDSFCFELERVDFEQLLRDSPVFRDFCTRRLANLLDHAYRHTQAGMASAVADDVSLNAPLASLTRRAPVSCAPHTSLQAALRTMQAERVGSMIVVDTAARPLGIFTLRDLLARLAAGDIDLAAPIERVMTLKPTCLPPTAPAYEALLYMTRSGVSHVCVAQQERLVGVISERDLFGMQRVGLAQLARAIAGADDVDALRAVVADVHRLVDQMLAHGMAVEQLVLIIALLNDQLTRAAIDIALASEGTDIPFTWLAFGSEGRREQTLKTDQDNGIVFRVSGARDAAQTRAVLLPIASKINHALAALGFPLCSGNVMASNPALCLDPGEWRERFRTWIEQPGPQALLNAATYFDMRPLYGDAAPADGLRDAIRQWAPANPQFLRQLAQQALANTPPLGFMGDFRLDERDHGAIDLKLKGAMPLIDGVRVLGLAHGVVETNSFARLHALKQLGAVPAPEAAAWHDALAFIMLLRLRHQRARQREGLSPDNHVRLDKLNELERRILKEAFRQARKLQARLAADYDL